MSLHEIDHLVHAWGLAVVFTATGLQALCVPVPGTTALIAAALYAATRHGLPIVGVIAAGALGAVVGSSLGFALGRWRGERVLLSVGRRLRQSPQRVQRLRGEFAARGGLWLFVGRFISGVRNLIGLTAGASGMPYRRFVSITAAAATVWALTNGLEYYYFGHALANADTWLQIALAGVGLAWLVVSLNLLRRGAMRGAA